MTDAEGTKITKPFVQSLIESGQFSAWYKHQLSGYKTYEELVRGDEILMELYRFLDELVSDGFIGEYVTWTKQHGLILIDVTTVHKL